MQLLNLTYLITLNLFSFSLAWYTYVSTFRKNGVCGQEREMGGWVVVFSPNEADEIYVQPYLCLCLSLSLSVSLSVSLFLSSSVYLFQPLSFFLSFFYPSVRIPHSFLLSLYLNCLYILFWDPLIHCLYFQFIYLF